MKKWLTDNEKEKIILFTAQGKSLNELRKIMGISKTTIYYHVRKHYGRKFKKPNIPKVYNKKIGEFIGIFAGDGSFHYNKSLGQYRIDFCFGKNNKKYLQYVRDLVYSVFNKRMYVVRDNTKLRLQTLSKDIYNFINLFLEYNSSSKCSTLKMKKIPNEEFKIGLIKGLIDTDGTVCNTITGIKIAYYTTSPTLSKQVLNYFNDFSFSSNMIKHSKENRKTVYTVYLHKKSISDFLTLIKPFKGKGLVA